MLVLIENSSGRCEYAEMFLSFGFGITFELDKADLVCFTGGADVTPSLYKEKKHTTTHNQEQRDKHCMELYNSCLELNIPMVGICRGSQFLCVANGGRLWQDIDGHLGDHDVLSVDGELFSVTSTHHQEMHPKGGKILLTAQNGTRRSYVNENGIEVTIPKSYPTVEAVYWESTRSLGVQGHPEFGRDRFKKWFMQQVAELMGV